jgi:uncharacterized cupin superfamily protein
MTGNSAPESAPHTATILGEVVRLVQPLKDDRDAWKARAEAYKAAFEDQTSRLNEAISLCISTRIELEQARARNPPPKEKAIVEAKNTHTAHVSRGSAGTRSSHTLLGDQPEFEWQSSPTAKAHFGLVEQLAGQENFAKARDELDHILPGRLTNEARVEGLLLKSAICRASGSDWVLDALAQCSEALALCDGMHGLAFLLPKIQYHRGLCLLRLCELEQARDAFAQVDPADPLHNRAKMYQQSCNGQLEDPELANRRSAFEENRTYAGGYLSSLRGGDRAAVCRPCLAHQALSLT